MKRLCILNNDSRMEVTTFSTFSLPFNVMTQVHLHSLHSLHSVFDQRHRGNKKQDISARDNDRRKVRQFLWPGIGADDVLLLSSSLLSRATLLSALFPAVCQT